MTPRLRRPHIRILSVARGAALTPYCFNDPNSASFRPKATNAFIFGDHRTDSTDLVGPGSTPIEREVPLEVNRSGYEPAGHFDQEVGDGIALFNAAGA